MLKRIKEKKIRVTEGYNHVWKANGPISDGSEMIWLLSNGLVCIPRDKLTLWE